MLHFQRGIPAVEQPLVRMRVQVVVCLPVYGFFHRLPGPFEFSIELLKNTFCL